jgi:hypothetical protein
MAKKRGARSQMNLEEKLLREQRAAFIKKFGREPGMSRQPSTRLP